MSKSQSTASPARSQGVVTPRRPRARRTRSAASPRSEPAGRLSSLVEEFVKDDFVPSPIKRRSVLPDDTEIEAPRRASWWKRLEGSSRDVLEALDTNKMTDELVVEEYEFEVEKGKQNQSVPESNDNESIASIVVPQKRLFNQKKQPQSKFTDMGTRKSLGRTNIEDESIEEAPKNLFNKGPRNKPVFPAALLNSTNKTINKTVEPEPSKQARPNLFGQASTKRKNIFADLVLSDSEEDSEVKHKIFGFKKNNNKRMSLGTRNRRMPSLTPSMTTETDIDDWYLLPSSTMIGAQEVSKMTVDDEPVPVREENQDDTLTEANESLNCEVNNQSKRKNSILQDDENDKTLTNENIEDASKNQDSKINESQKNNKTHERSKSKLNESVKDKTLLNKSSTRANAENEEIEDAIVERQQNNAGTKKQITVMKEQSLEDKVAELHGESVDKEESQQNMLLNITKEKVENYKDTKIENKSEQEIKPSAEQQEVQNVSKAASNANQNEVVDDLPENVIFSGKQLERTRNYEAQKSHNVSKAASNVDLNELDYDLPENVIFNGKQLERTRNNEAQKSQNGTKDASNINRDKNIDDVRVKYKSCIQESQAHSPGEANDTNQDEDMENKGDEEIEYRYEEPETHDHSKEESQTNEDEVMTDISEKDKSEEESEPSDHDEDSQDESKEESQENEDEEIDDVFQKDKSEDIEPCVNDQESQNDSKEKSYENEEEDIEEMVWNDNDDEKASDTSEARINAKAKQNDEVAPGENDNKTAANDRTLERKDITNKSRNLTNKSHKIVESSVDNDEMEEDVVDETPNNSTHDTTGRNRKKETLVKSPEAVLQNMTTDNESFRPIGRSTTFRKSKSLYETMNRPSLAPVQESTLGSEGSRNSSTEGSEWDSHRTTRKTIRQTFGKEYTTRKSVRALVMEQSAKRQTELYSKNTSNINKTKNKSVLEGIDKNASKLNKTKNKTVLDEANKTATTDKTNNKTVSEDVNDKNASTKNKTRNKTVLEDINDQRIRFRRSSTRNLSSSMQLASPIPKSPAHGTSSHHVLDPLISEHQVSYHKSLHDVTDPEISEQISNREDSINIPVVENNDSGPEISMNASYGQGMSADTAQIEASDIEMKENYPLRGMEDEEIPHRNASVRAKSIHSSDQEALDYEASELEKSEQDISDNEVDQENVELDDSVQESVQDEEKENSAPEELENEEAEESGLENEDSQQEIEIESEIDADSDHEESQQEIESEQEESQQEIEPESDQEESQQEIDVESDHDEAQQEIESEQEESQQEIEPESDREESQQEIDAESDHDESQQEIESEQAESQEIEPESDQEESQQEIELASDHESDNEDRDNSRPDSDQESAELSRAPERDSEDENEDLVSGLHSQYHNTNSRVSRVVFDSHMSGEEIDFGGVSRQTDNDISEQSEREISRNPLPRVSEPSVHEISAGTKKSMMLIQMQKIAQNNMERRQKIREQVQNWLKPPRTCTSPVPNYSIRRITKAPRQPKKPKRTGIPLETLPRAFVEDLIYKPPKRYQPANAPWITKRLYTFLETKLEPKYDYRARVRAEELVQSIHSFAKLVRRRDVAPPRAVDELKQEMARLKIVNTHFDFYEFIQDFMPREIRVKVRPDVVNKIPMPRNGVFGEILQPRAAVE